ADYRSERGLLASVRLTFAVAVGVGGLWAATISARRPGWVVATCAVGTVWLALPAGYALRTDNYSPYDELVVAVFVAVFAAAAGLVSLAGPAAAASTGFAVGAAPDDAPAGVDVPVGTVGHAGPFLVDGEGRALLPHGVSLPVAQAATDDELDAWVRAGLSAVRLVVPVATDGTLPGLGEPPALDALLAAVDRYADRGFWVVVRMSPAQTGSVLTQPATVAAVAAVSTALRDAPGLIGYEVAVPGSVDETALTAAVRRNDPHHSLWRELPASIDPTATVAVAGEAAYLVSWGNGTVATTRRIAAAAEAAPMGWFYD
nr:hypothetical protein [Micromonospora sp. DSM 115978]